MSLPGSGCCCGLIAGIILTLLVAVTGTVAVYCWLNPEARKSGVSAVEKGWQDFKDFGDDLISGAKDAEIPPPPEPKLDIKFN